MPWSDPPGRMTAEDIVDLRRWADVYVPPSERIRVRERYERYMQRQSA